MNRFNRSIHFGYISHEAHLLLLCLEFGKVYASCHYDSWLLDELSDAHYILVWEFFGELYFCLNH